jgi:molecular chaperone GrpE
MTENINDAHENEAVEKDTTESVENNTQTQENAESQSESATSASLEKEYNELKDKYLRLFAEFDTFRRRSAKEKIEMEKNAALKTIAALVPVLDDFERAIKNEGDNLPEGIKLLFEKFVTTLENQGLKVMESTSAVFDADLHEAVTEFPAPTEDLKGKVVDTVLKGYYLNETIVRHAKVVVGR